MQKQKTRPHRVDATGKLHPSIFRILMGFVGGWFLITLSFFMGANGGGHNYGGLIILVVAIFALIVVLLPARIRYIALHHPVGRNIAPSHSTLKDWLNGELVIWNDHVRGLDAAIAILLPGVAAMLGGVALAIVFHMVTP